MKLPRIRRLGEVLAELFAPPREAARLAREDDALFEADTRALDRARRQSQPRRVTVSSADCPLPGCDTCEPTPSVEVRRDVAVVVLWLLVELPEMWNDAPPSDVQELAEQLLDLKEQVTAGRWKP